jgi:hypothetical protein
MAGLLLVLLASSAAQADPSPAPAPRPAASQAPDPKVVELYREARELVNAGRWDEACPKFEQAMGKQPTASILVNVGDCHAHFGKLAQALDDYAVARELNRDTRDEARRAALTAEIDAREGALSPRVPRLRVVIESPAPGMVVRRNGEVIPSDLLGAEVAVDPGTYDFTAEAPGHTAAPRRIALKEGARERVTIRFERRSFAEAHVASLSIAGGAGLLAGAGAALAGWTVSTHASLAEVCRTGEEPACAERKDTVASGALVTNVAFGAAGAAALAAVLVFALAERPGGAAATVAISGTGASLRVAW